jgi:hypothetical protein
MCNAPARGAISARREKSAFIGHLSTDSVSPILTRLPRLAAHHMRRGCWLCLYEVCAWLKCVTGRILLDSESESRARRVRYGTCLPGLGVRVQGPESALRDVSSWTRSQSPGSGKCVTGRVLLDSESESRAFRAFHLFTRAWTRSQSLGRSGRFSCSRGHGLGVRVLGVVGESVVRAGMDSESESRAFWAFQLFARAWTRILGLWQLPYPPPRRRFFRPAVGLSSNPAQRRPAATRPRSPGFACAHAQIYPHGSGRIRPWIR